MLKSCCFPYSKKVGYIVVDNKDTIRYVATTEEEAHIVAKKYDIKHYTIAYFTAVES